MNRDVLRRKDGFTLIELLVVISIIALLLAILMPSLYKAREQAKRISCMNNVKQIALGIYLYCLDYEGRFPNYDEIGSSNVLFAGTRGNYPNHKAHEIGADRRIVNPYMGIKDAKPDTDVDVCRCPSDNGTPDVSENPRETTYWLFGSSYVYNYYAPTSPNPLTLSKSQLDKVDTPSRVVTTGCAPLWNYWSEVPDERRQRWHREGQKPMASIGFVDQSVRFIEILPENTNEEYTFIPERKNRKVVQEVQW